MSLRFCHQRVFLLFFSFFVCLFHKLEEDLGEVGAGGNFQDTFFFCLVCSFDKKWVLFFFTRSHWDEMESVGASLILPFRPCQASFSNSVFF